jgi:hypothetical protein
LFEAALIHELRPKPSCIEHFIEFILVRELPQRICQVAYLRTVQEHIFSRRTIGADHREGF